MKLYGTRQAAEYLGLHVQTMKYHLRQGNIAAEKIGGVMVFTQDELDRFKRDKRGPGRPKENTR